MIGNSLGSHSSVLSSTPCYWVTLLLGVLVTLIPPCPQQIYICIFFPHMPTFPSLVAAQKCVYRSCDLDAIGQVQSFRWEPRDSVGSKFGSYRITALHYHLRIWIVSNLLIVNLLIIINLLFQRKNIQYSLWYMIGVCIGHNCDPNKTLIMIHMHRVEI